MAVPARRSALTPEMVLPKAPTLPHPVAPPVEIPPVKIAKAETRMIMVSARIPVTLRQRVRQYIFDHDSTLQELMIAALDDYMSTHP